MKKVILVLIICGLTHLVKGQTDPVSKVFNKYAGAKGFTTVNITGSMLKMLGRIDFEDEDLQAISKLEGIKILTQEDKTAGYEDLNFYDEIYNELDKTLYKELLVVVDQDEHVNMLVREDNGIITEFLLIVTSDDENVLINIKGEIELSKLGKLTGSIDLKHNDKIKVASNCHH